MNRAPVVRCFSNRLLRKDHPVPLPRSLLEPRSYRHAGAIVVVAVLSVMIVMVALRFPWVSVVTVPLVPALGLALGLAERVHRGRTVEQR